LVKMSLKGELEEKIEYGLLVDRFLYDKQLKQRREIDIPLNGPIIWSHDGRKLIFVRNRDDKSYLYQLDLNSWNEKFLRKMDKVSVSNLMSDTLYGLVYSGEHNKFLIDLKSDHWAGLPNMPIDKELSRDGKVTVDIENSHISVMDIIFKHIYYTEDNCQYSQISQNGQWIGFRNYADARGNLVVSQYDGKRRSKFSDGFILSVSNHGDLAHKPDNKKGIYVNDTQISVPNINLGQSKNPHITKVDFSWDCTYLAIEYIVSHSDISRLATIDLSTNKAYEYSRPKSWSWRPRS